MTRRSLERKQSAFVAVAALLCIAGAGTVGLATVFDSGQAADSPPADGRPTATADRVTSPAADYAAAAESSGEPRTRATTTPANVTHARRNSYTVGEGANETVVRVIDSGRPGPTVLVVSGLHGNELAGFHAGHDIADWRIDRGTLVVVPEANPRAVRNGTRKVNGRDLNAKFPVGERPTTAQARIVWRIVGNHDPDIVVDLHSSQGIYGVDGGVGQAVFPSVTGDAVEHTDVAIHSVNDAYDLTGNRSFRRGNSLGPSGQTLTRKAIGDRDATAYIVETTQRNTTLETRVEWTKALTWELLRLHGVVDDPYWSASAGASVDSRRAGLAGDDRAD